ncbi:MAG: hypothetical protein QG656_2546 [Candidatus Hydrogenedentes bacterium]|nr:hypothetical protein [Candidatus Hydrogenedentota bacterium]
MAALLLFAAACGSKPVPPAEAPSVSAPEPAAASEPAAEPAGPEMTMTGINIYMHDKRPTLGTPRKPTFWVKAETFTSTEDGLRSFKNARAVVYSRKEGEPDIVFEAKNGWMKEEERAFLDQGVVGTIGTMTLELEDIEWLNEERLAKTDKPVRMVDGEMHLDAATLRLYPDERKYVMTDAEGVLLLERKEP